MDHWFDRLTKGLAQGKLSRREVLGAAIKASVAAIGAPLLSRSDALAQMVSGETESQPRANTCQGRREGRTRIFSVSASSTLAGKPLTYNQTTRKVSRNGNTEITKTIRLGGSTLLQIEAVRRATSTQINITYGEGFQGIKRATFTSSDGKTLQGDVDGHRLQPFRVGSDPKSLKAADNSPSPNVKVSSQTSEAISSILDKARQIAQNCSSGRAGLAAPMGGLADSREFFEPGSRGTPLKLADRHPGGSYATASALAQGDSGHDSYPEQSGACLACEGTCTAVGIACGAVAAAACVLSFGFGCAGAVAACVLTEIGCWEGCHAIGFPCCPVACGDVACCDKPETCLDPNRGVCCSKGLNACANKHCCKPTDTCINATGFCCPAGLTVCNNICCKQGEVCKDGVACCPPAQVTCGGVCSGSNEVCVNNKKCCAKESACGNVCCDKLTKCADKNASLCCSFATQVCGETCCKTGQQCINGKCCSKPCGSVCCSSAQGCQDGKCISKKCTPGQVTCISQESSSKLGAALCCPPNVQCCLGKCCKKGELCCSGGGMPFGCHDPGLCVA